MERVHAAGAKFDYEKAKWFNHEWMKKKEVRSMIYDVRNLLEANNIPVNDESFLEKVIELVRERCTLLTDFVQQAGFFFKAPEAIDTDAVKPKWNEEKKNFFVEFAKQLQTPGNWNMTEIETVFKNLATEKNIKPGELQLPMRVMLVGGKFGPAVFQIAELIGKEETIKRIEKALHLLEA
jgi:glutamyl-tRNA synthetase